MNSTLMSIGPSRARKRRARGARAGAAPRRWRSPLRSPPRRKRLPPQVRWRLLSIPSAAGSSEQAGQVASTFKGAGKEVEKFGDEAGDAAKIDDGAKGAADAVVRIPGTRVVSGHEKCAVAPNGAPDCVAAADAMCKTKGFASGKSLDMTTAEVCPAEGLSRRPQHRPRLHTPTPSSPARSANSAALVGAPRACVSVAPIANGRAGEPSCQVARARGRRQAGHRRRDRRRQVRHHVPVAGAADARHARRRRRRSRRRARAQPTQDRGLAGGAIRRGLARRRAQDARDVRHRQMPTR